MDSVVNAGAGNDTLKGGIGLDSFDAGPGNDMLNPTGSSTDAVNDVFEGGDGNDTFQADLGRHGHPARRARETTAWCARGESVASPSADLFDGGSGRRRGGLRRRAPGPSC